MVFSTNQARQLYVAKSLASAKVTKSGAAGTIRPVSDNAKSHLYFEYKGADNLMRSDLIDLKNILYAKVTDADSMKHNLRSVLVTLDSAVNSGNPVSGQDYILRIMIDHFVGMTEEDVYIKFGCVRVTTGMSASEFYKAMAISLAKNFSRDISNLFQFKLKTSSSTVEVNADTKAASLTGTYTGILINEVEQDWVLGTKEQTPVNFNIVCVPITVGDDELTWGKSVDQAAAGVVNNGKKIADLEYFCMGERGDVYRNVGWPNTIRTTYLVDPSKAYNVIDIHFAFVDGGESPQKSERTLTIVVPKEGANLAAKQALTNSIISAINAAAGSNILTALPTTE